MTKPLELLLADGVIDDVLGRLKSGKEADISLVRRGGVVMAAKVYKDRATRSFKNNADYKEGRKVRNSRTQRAIDSGGSFGRDAAEEAWKSAEADALYKLADHGVRVPQPVMFYEGVLLMDLVRDAEGRPAPRLIDLTLDPAAALSLYADLCSQIITMLCCDLIHGDLSPYNILASADGPTIIDFPQVISAVHSSRAEYFFLRDFDNVVQYVAGFDPALAVHRADGRAIWRAYVGRELTPEFVPPPPMLEPRGRRRGRGRGREGHGRGYEGHNPGSNGASFGGPPVGGERSSNRDGAGVGGGGRGGALGGPRGGSGRGPGGPRNGPGGGGPRNGPGGGGPRNGPGGGGPRNGPRNGPPNGPRNGPYNGPRNAAAPTPRPGWSEARPSASPPPAKRGGRRRPKRRF